MIPPRAVLALILSALLSLAASEANVVAGLAVLTVSLGSTAVLPAPQSLPPSTHAVLTTAHRPPLVARLDRRNRCIFPAVPPGSYLLEIISRDVAFEAARVDVTLDAAAGGSDDTTEAQQQQQQQQQQANAAARRQGVPRGDAAVRVEAWQTFRGHAWANTGERLGVARGSLEIAARPTATRTLFETRQGFNVAGLLSNPMILIGLVGMGLVLGMPKLLENMDPETRKEFEEHQRQSPIASSLAGGANPMSNFDMAAWMAGSKRGDAASAEDTATGAEIGGGAKARRRA